MSCPLYNDYTRECIQHFKEVVKIINFDFCESDKNLQCPFYRIINKIEPICEYAKRCPVYFHTAEKNFDSLVDMTEKYCFSDNYTNCARFKQRKNGKHPPKGLYPDGNMVELE